MSDKKNLPQAIAIRLDLNKITGEHAFEGKKGLWQDVIIRHTPNSKYGDDYIAVINVKDGDDIILGNAKVLEARAKEVTKKPSSKLPWE